MATENFDRYNLGWDSADGAVTRFGDNVREDLSDMIYNIAPYRTPFMTMMVTGRARNTYTEWQTDDLDSVNPANARVDGAIAGDDTSSKSSRVGNQCQISDKVLKISGRAESVDKAGRRSEMGYQLAKAGKSLKRDMEAILTSGQGSAGGDSTNASATAGLAAWISTNADLGATNGGVPGWVGGTVAPADDGTPGTPRGLTEAMLRAGVLDAYNNGGEPGTLMMSPQKKQTVSEYLFTSSARVATLYKDTAGESGQATALGAVDVFVSDFGTLKLVPNRFWGHNGTAADDTYIAGLQENMWACLYLRSFRTNRLAKTGDAENRQLIVDYALRANNEAANFQIRDLDDSAMIAA